MSQAVGSSRADDDGLAAEPRAELCREIADAEDLVAADIDRRSRRVAMREAAQRLRRGVALPDEVDVAEADVDRLAVKDLCRDVVQHAVAHVDRVVQPEQSAGRCEFAREIFKHALASDAGLRVFAGRIGRERLIGALSVHRHERINAAGRERHDPRARKGLRDQRGDMGIHRPGQRQIALRAKLASGHEDDVRGLRQRLDGGLIEQVAVDGLDAASLQPAFTLASLKRATPMMRRSGRAALASPASVGPIFPATPRIMMSPSTLPEIVDQRLARPAQQIVKGCDIGNGVRQTVAREQHVSSLKILIAAARP